MSGRLPEYVPARTEVEEGSGAGRTSERKHRGTATGPHLRAKARVAGSVLTRTAGDRSSERLAARVLEKPPT